MKKFFVIIASMFAMASVAHADVYIEVDKSEQVMYVDSPVGSFAWDVSTARDGYHTPEGKYKPTLMKKMHYSRKYDNSPMPYSIFFYGGYAIHGTSHVNDLGHVASHGCVRLSPQNARWLYRIVNEEGMKNTHIKIVP